VGTLLRLPFDRHIAERADWLTGLRWIVLSLVAIAALIGNAVLGLQVPSLAIWATLIGIAAYNLAFRAIARSNVLHDTRVGLHAQLLRTQIIVDMLALTLLLHLSGGVENPFSPYYLLLMLIGSILMTRKDSYLFAATGSLLWASLLLLEAGGIVPHYNLQGFRLPTRYMEWSHIGAEIAVLTSAAFLITYLSSNVVARLRDSERRLYETNRSCEARAYELDRVNERLQDMDRTRTQFIRLVTHELRAPVAAIQSFLRLIIEGYVKPEDMLPIIVKAEQRANDQLDLISDLLDLAHIRDRVPATDTPPCDIVHVLTDVLDMMQARMDDKAQKRTLVIADDTPPVTCMRDEQVKRIWTNLVSNAVKYTPEGGEITISVGREGSMLVCSVQDTGIGIAPEDQEHVFEEFYRTERAKEMARHGTGLGLSIARGVVESCGGTMSLRSAVGVGSTFTFTLPIAAPPRETEL
jgi:signal transduction histidine kinase